jgi:hypothetical protein
MHLDSDSKVTCLWRFVATLKHMRPSHSRVYLRITYHQTTLWRRSLPARGVGGAVHGGAGTFGGCPGPHKIFAYRSNLLYGDGTQFVAESRRRLAEFAFDLRPTDRTTRDAHYT